MTAELRQLLSEIREHVEIDLYGVKELSAEEKVRLHHKFTFPEDPSPIYRTNMYLIFTEEQDWRHATTVCAKLKTRAILDVNAYGYFIAIADFTADKYLLENLTPKGPMKGAV